jgi:hypothetical protein
MMMTGRVVLAGRSASGRRRTRISSECRKAEAEHSCQQEDGFIHDANKLQSLLRLFSHVCLLLRSADISVITPNQLSRSQPAIAKTGSGRFSGLLHFKATTLPHTSFEPRIAVAFNALPHTTKPTKTSEVSKINSPALRVPNLSGT